MGGMGRHWRRSGRGHTSTLEEGGGIAQGRWLKLGARWEKRGAGETGRNWFFFALLLHLHLLFLQLPHLLLSRNREENVEKEPIPTPVPGTTCFRDALYYAVLFLSWRQCWTLTESMKKGSTGAFLAPQVLEGPLITKLAGPRDARHASNTLLTIRLSSVSLASVMGSQHLPQ